MNLSIVIPAYNEAERITPTIHQFYKYLIAKHIPFEILVVDDGSADDTVAVVTALQPNMPQLTVLPLPANKGKGNAVRQGMLAARGSVRVFSDADGSTPIEELEKLLQTLERGDTDISIGSRYVEGAEVTAAQPKFRVVWSRLTNKLVQRMLLPGIADPHCGFKAFTADAARKVFQQCSVDGWSFDLEALAIARKLHLKITEVPVKWANDERSKGRIS
ncbi:MAG: glycosyltransferase family 2 protein, partial [Sphingobacteriales bacterium]